MKKLIYCAAAMSALVFTACQQEVLEPVSENASVTFTVEVPGAAATKALGDDVTHINDLVYAVYKTEANTLETAVADMDANMLVYQKNPESTAFANGRTNVSIELLNDQNYVILFWAQVNDTWVAGENFDLTDITYPASMAANNDVYAAFSGVSFIESASGTIEKNVILTRPFAQINLGTTLPENFTVNFLTSEVIVSNVGKSFSVATQVATDNTDVTFNAAALPAELLSVSGNTYTYVAMNYVFANSTVEVEFNINTELHGTVNHTVPNVPVQKNYRTNIVGNLLTTTAEYEVILDNSWNQPETVIGDAWSQTGDYAYTVNEGAPAATLADVLAHADAAARAAATKAAGPVVTIELDGDVEWKTGAGIGSTPLLPEDSPISAVVINGNGKTFTATGSGVGKVRLANGSLLTFNNVKVVDQSVSYAENSWEYGYLEFGGNLEFNECEFVNAVMMSADNAAFANCSFNSNKDNEYDVWVDEGSASFEGCTFAGARGLKVHEAYGSEVAAVTVDGCTFGPLSKKPGIALGDLNAETSVTIKNSTFDRCQAGDQGLFIYETDTDVTTFTFVCEDNLVIPSGDAAVEQEDGTVIVSTAAGLKAAIAAANNDKFTEIKLADGTYTGAFDIDAKSVKIVAMNRHQATIDGLVHGLNFAHVTLEGVVLTNATPAASASARHNADYYCLGSYVTDWVIEDCIFNVNNQGQAAGKGAINIYAGRDDYELYDGFEFTVKNTVFNCNGERPIRGKTNSLVEGCTFVDQHRYAIQVQGNSGLASETVKFVNNTIVNPCQTSGEAYVASVSISKSQLLENAAFIIEGNTDAKFVYDNHDNVKITTCTLNGAAIAAGQCVSIPNVTDAKEVKFEYIDGATFVATAADLTAALDAKALNIVLLPGVYDGTFAIKADNTTIEGQEGAVVACINLNGAKNTTIKNVEFDAAKAVRGYDYKKSAKQFANIITGDLTNNPIIGAHGVVIDGCKFTGKFANGGASIAFTDYNRTSGFSGNITIKNCTFDTENAYYNIYGHYCGNGTNGFGDFVIENNTFNTTFTAGGAIYLGRYASSTPVVVKGNTFNVAKSLDEAMYVQDHSNYGVSINASNNTFAN